MRFENRLRNWYNDVRVGSLNADQARIFKLVGDFLGITTPVSPSVSRYYDEPTPVAASMSNYVHHRVTGSHDSPSFYDDRISMITPRGYIADIPADIPPPDESVPGRNRADTRIQLGNPGSISDVTQMVLPEDASSDDYVRAQDLCGLRVGDAVSVTRTAGDHERGWGNSWPPSMDQQVGRVHRIRSINNGAGVRLEGTDMSYPFFVLERVNIIDAGF